VCHEARSNVEVGHDDDSLFLFVNQFLTVLRRCSTIEMKSMERAKSFVASRSTVSGSRYKAEKTTSGTAAAEAAKNNKFKRSNSLVGVGHPNQSSHLDSKETGQPPGTKSRLKAKAKLLVQLQSMQSKVKSIDQLLHGLRDLSDESKGSDYHHEAIAELVQEIGTHVKIVRNSLLFLCRSYLLEKQIAILVSVQEQIYPTLDISVRFFGIDWKHIFRVSYNLVQSVNLMRETLIQGTSTIATDVLLPSNILRSLATIEADASSHVEAVLHGRLSEHTSTPLPSPPPTSDLPVETVSPAAATKSQPQSGLGGGKGRQMIDEFRRKVRRVIRLPKSVSVHSYISHGQTRLSMTENGLLDKGRQIDKRAQSHHDALWRAWYVGLQTITIPASFEPAVASSSDQYRLTEAVEVNHPLGTTDISWHPDTIKVIDDGISSVLSDPIQNDESFDSMTLTLTMARAPIVDENQL